MSSTIAYRLPFSFSVPPAGMLGRGGDFSLSVTFDSPPQAEGGDIVGGVVTAWILLGTTGAMAGARVPPRAVGIRELQSLVAPNGMQWSISGVAIDDLAPNVLASLMLVANEQMDGAKIRSVRLLPLGNPTVGTPVVVAEGAWDVYPPPAPVGFACHVDGEPMEELAVQIEFKQPLSEGQIDVIRNELLVWSAAVSGGGYGIAPSSPVDCGCVVDDDIEFVVDEVVLSLSQFRAHPGAIDGLVSVCARLDATCAPIASFAVD